MVKELKLTYTAGYSRRVVEHNYDVTDTADGEVEVYRERLDSDHEDVYLYLDRVSATKLAQALLDVVAQSRMRG